MPYCSVNDVSDANFGDKNKSMQLSWVLFFIFIVSEVNWEQFSGTTINLLKSHHDINMKGDKYELWNEFCAVQGR